MIIIVFIRLQGPIIIILLSIISNLFPTDNFYFPGISAQSDELSKTVVAKYNTCGNNTGCYGNTHIFQYSLLKLVSYGIWISILLGIWYIWVFVMSPPIG